MEKWLPSGPQFVRGAVVAAAGGVLAALVIRWLDGRQDQN